MCETRSSPDQFFQIAFQTNRSGVIFPSIVHPSRHPLPLSEAGQIFAGESWPPGRKGPLAARFEFHHGLLALLCPMHSRGRVGVPSARSRRVATADWAPNSLSALCPGGTFGVVFLDPLDLAPGTPTLPSSRSSSDKVELGGHPAVDIQQSVGMELKMVIERDSSTQVAVLSRPMIRTRKSSGPCGKLVEVSTSSFCSWQGGATQEYRGSFEEPQRRKGRKEPMESQRNLPHETLAGAVQRPRQNVGQSDHRTYAVGARSSIKLGF